MSSLIGNAFLILAFFVAIWGFRLLAQTSPQAVLRPIRVSKPREISPRAAADHRAWPGSGPAY
jgi:hypothetical protein